jgi:hypothetical protein
LLLSQAAAPSREAILKASREVMGQARYATFVKITPTRLEIVAESLGMTNDPSTWRPVTLNVPWFRGGARRTG